MRIKITADSSCDLSREQLAKYDSTLAPLSVAIGGRSLLDGVELRPDEIYAHVAKGGDLPVTSAVNPAQYADLFAPFSETCDAVIHITIGSGFSSCYQNACLAAAEFDNVHVVDSCSLSTGQGILVMEAASMAAQGTNADEIVEKLSALTKKVQISFVLEQLEYMKKGGRCSAVAVLGANMLKLKPCIAVQDGKMGVVKKYRGSMEKCLRDYVADQLKGKDGVVRSRLLLTHSGVDASLVELVRQEIAKYVDFEEIAENRAGCTVSSHCGPGTIGIIYFEQ